MDLVCSNPKCESREDDTPMFTINVTVCGGRDLAENLNKVEPEFFTCVYCHSEATTDKGGA